MRFKYEELSSSPLLVNSIYEGGSKNNPAADDPLTKLFQIQGFKSVGNRGGFRKSKKENNSKPHEDIAYCVIFSKKNVQVWPNKYDETTGTFIYYGDNRVPGNHHLNTKQKGNAWLKEIFEKAYDSTESRKTIPPMFVFESTGVGQNVEFLGVAVPGIKGNTINQSLELKTFSDPQGQFQNYKAHLTMIKIEPEGVNRAWLSQLKSINSGSLKFAPKEWINFVMDGPNSVTSQKSKDINAVDNITGLIFPSEKQYLQKVRTTQGKFRERLLQEKSTCNICGMDITNLLVASHIKPWKDSNDVERIDFFNGLLLCPSHNAAFDGGYISFDNMGKIKISKVLNKDNKNLLQVNENIKIVLDARHLHYMHWHIRKVFQM